MVAPKAGHSSAFGIAGHDDQPERALDRQFNQRPGPHSIGFDDLFAAVYAVKNGRCLFVFW